MVAMGAPLLIQGAPFVLERDLFLAHRIGEAVAGDGLAHRQARARQINVALGIREATRVLVGDAPRVLAGVADEAGRLTDLIEVVVNQDLDGIELTGSAQAFGDRVQGVVPVSVAKVALLDASGDTMGARAIRKVALGGAGRADGIVGQILIVATWAGHIVNLLCGCVLSKV